MIQPNKERFLSLRCCAIYRENAAPYFVILFTANASILPFALVVAGRGWNQNAAFYFDAAAFAVGALTRYIALRIVSARKVPLAAVNE